MVKALTRALSKLLSKPLSKALSVSQHSVFAYVSLAALTALICATALPSFARNTIANATVNATVNVIAQTTPAQTEAQQLEQKGRNNYDAGQFSDAVAAFEQAASLYQRSGNLEQARESQINQAKALQALGLYNRAIVILQAVLQTPQPTPLLEDLQVEIRCSEEKNVLNPLRERLEALPVSSTNAATTAAALRGLGDALQVTGDLEQSCTILRYSLELAETWSLTDALAPTYLSLGNLARTQAIADLRVSNLTPKQAIAQLQKQLSPIQQELQRRRTEAAAQFMRQTGVALDYYQQAQQTASDAIPLIQAQAQLNALSLRLERQEGAEAAATVPALYSLLNSLPLSRSAIEAQINLAQSLMRLAEQPSEPTASSPDLMRQAAQLLAAAQQQATDLGVAQMESYALGSLGGLYQRTQQWSEAKAVTQQALEKVNAVSVTNLPRTTNDVDLAYRWYRQLGQILIAQGDEEGAIKAYETAVELLQETLELDVASSNLNYQLSFNQDALEPIHRELMDLLLRAEEPSQENLKQVREVSTSLLEAELTSFLQEPCTVTKPGEIDEILQDTAQRTAVFYPIILPDRLEVIVKLPGDQNLLHYRHRISQDRLLEKLNHLQLALEEDYTFEAVETLAQQFYEWMVQPAAEQLKANQINTLVFTLDRQLQTVPMAALHDGETYLIEKYAVAEILGLKFASSDQPLQPEELKVIGAGFSKKTDVQTVGGEDVRGLFPPLDYVQEEMQIIDNLKIPAVTLLDNEFNLVNFSAQLNEEKFPVVHLATHGQFSFDPKRTFLLTADPDPVDVDQLAGLFRTRKQIRLDAIELLVLNACETASGDNLETLGIAGAAVRAGARSAIASLWTLNDELSIGFTRMLYEHLRQPDVSKAKALQQAQLALLHNDQYRHPRYWSPYILAGNWLPLTSSRSNGTADSSPLN